MVLLSLPFAAAAAELPAPIPIVFMTGGQGQLTDAVTGELYDSAFDINMENAGESFAKSQDALIAAIQKLDWATVGRIFGLFVWESFGELQMWPDGTSKNSVFRSETTSVAGYDALDYLAPLHEGPATPYPTLPEQTPSNPIIPQAVSDFFNKLFKTVSKILEPLTNRVGAFVGDIGSLLQDAFFNVYNGTEKYLDDSGLKATQPEPDSAWKKVDTINADVYNFSFDWRLSPLDIADQVQDYIKCVIAATGAPKVCLRGQSSSCAVALAYVDKYVNKAANPDDILIDSVLFQISMAEGMATYGTFLQKKLTIDASALGHSELMQVFMSEANPQVHALLNTLYLSGLLDAVCSLTEFVPQEMLDTFFDEAFIPFYGMFPGMWSLIPPDMYEEAKKVSLGAHLNDPEYKDLLGKIDAYAALTLNDHEILQKAAEKVKIAVVAGSGRTGWPVALGQEQGQRGDSAVEVKYASFGATVALLGQTLGTNYKQKVTDVAGHNHISPDNIIDASTCALPDNTWFIDDITHITDEDMSGFFAWWYSTDDANVYSSARWPQYLYAYGNITTGHQDYIFPKQTPVFSSNKFMALSDLWSKVLTLWNRVLFLFTGGSSGVLNGISGLFK
jgi:hypothetical protein